MSFVLDSSATIAWLMPDEHNRTAHNLLDRIEERGAVVPTIWRIEIGNSLLFAHRRGRISLVHRAAALRHLDTLPIEVDPETLSLAWSATLGFADRFRLTLYDACYLELAQRRALPLATLDKDLRAAGRKLGIPLL
jgi:predicted nucleic acid-binding protein